MNILYYEYYKGVIYLNDCENCIYDVLKLIQDTCKKNKITTVIITHNQDIVPMADKVIHFNSGKILKCECNSCPLDIEEFEW